MQGVRWHQGAHEILGHPNGALPVATPACAHAGRARRNLRPQVHRDVRLGGPDADTNPSAKKAARHAGCCGCGAAAAALSQSQPPLHPLHMLVHGILAWRHTQLWRSHMRPFLPTDLQPHARSTFMCLGCRSSAVAVGTC